jgi:hypothetical protein
MTEDDRKGRPALVATAVAVPIAIAAGVAAFAVFTGDRVDPSATPTAAARVASTSPVSTPLPPPSAASRTLCKAFMTRLPPQVRGLPQRPVVDAAGYAVAYGDPPVIVACGVSGPPVGQTDQLYEMNGVCWHPSSDSEWTAIGRDIPVRIFVRGAQAGQAQWVNEFSDLVSAVIPADGSRCGAG